MGAVINDIYAQCFSSREVVSVEKYTMELEFVYKKNKAIGNTTERNVYRRGYSVLMTYLDNNSVLCRSVIQIKDFKYSQDYTPGVCRNDLILHLLLTDTATAKDFEIDFTFVYRMVILNTSTTTDPTSWSKDPDVFSDSQSGGGSGGGSGAGTDEPIGDGKGWTTNTACGALAANQAISSDMSVIDILKAMTVAYLKPVITSFKGTASTLNLIGETLANTTLSVVVTKKSKPITSIQFLKDGSLLYEDTAHPNGGTVSYPYNNVIKANTTFSVAVSDGTSTEIKTLTYTFVNPYYYGMTNSVAPNESDILLMTKLKSAKAAQTCAYTGVNQRCSFAYPAAYGALTKILDQNNFDVTSGFVKSTVTVGGVSCFVYTTAAAATLNGFKYTFQI